jgi:hypothetical protein
MSSTHHSIAVLLACSSAALCGCGSDEGARAAGGDDGSGGSSSSHSDHSAGAGATGSGGTGAGGTTTSGSGGGDEGPNDFFEELAQRPETVFAYSLRTQAEVEQYTHGDNDPALLRYDEEMDAARITLPADIPSAQQLWLPIHMAEAGQTVIVWDWRGSENWVYENGLRVHKMFQVRRQSDHIWLEPGSVYLPDAGGTRHSRVRIYAGVGPDTFSPDGGFDFSDGFGDIHYDSDSIGPVHSNFTSPADTWVRLMLVIEQQPDDPWAHVWYYGAHEGHDPTPILLDAQISLPSDAGVEGAGRPHHFDFEVNTSATRTGPEVWCWGKNVVVMRGVDDPASLLRRPVR